MKCKVQWIDVNGAPTPDDHEAVGVARCWSSVNGAPLVPLGEELPICAEHARQLKTWHETRYADTRIITVWEFRLTVREVK